MSTYELPIFPLALVLFPGATQTLHIFEPRYRKLLADCLDGDRRFGIAVLDERAGGTPPEPGAIGCRAFVQFAAPLPDGRSNIITVGEERFVLREWLPDAEPYRRARVEPYTDLDEPASPALDGLAEEVRAAYARYARLVAALQDSEDAPPALPDDPGAMSFAVAGSLSADVSLKYELLRQRSAEGRLRSLQQLLKLAHQELEPRVAMHKRARGNGKGPHGARIEVSEG